MQFSVDCIDLGNEESASMLDEQVEDARAWLDADVDSAECVVMLDDAARDELLRMAQQMREDPLPVLLRDEPPGAGEFAGSEPGVHVADCVQLLEAVRAI